MSITTYANCISNLLSTLAAVPGVEKAVNGYPTSKQPSVLVYLHANRGTRQIAGHLANTWNFITASLCISMQENYIAEDRIAPYINSIPAALDANPTLGGTCNQVRVDDWLADVRDIGEVPCRVIDFTVAIHIKGQYQAGVT